PTHSILVPGRAGARQSRPAAPKRSTRPRWSELAERLPHAWRPSPEYQECPPSGPCIGLPVPAGLPPVGSRKQRSVVLGVSSSNLLCPIVYSIYRCHQEWDQVWFGFGTFEVTVLGRTFSTCRWGSAH